MLAPARRDRGLLRHQRGDILIADLRRRQEEHQDGETEGGDLLPPSVRYATGTIRTLNATLRDAHSR
jgi:hypothetical protein